MKKHFPVKDQNGNAVKGWAFEYFKDAINVGCYDSEGKRLPPRKFNGWSLFDPEGYERCYEGNWLSFVDYAKQVIENHGCTTTLS